MIFFIVVFGLGSKTLLTQLIAGYACDNCEIKDTTHAIIYGDFPYLFWIPLFPIHKSSKIICDNCDREMTYSKVRKSEDHEDIKYILKDLKKEARHPWTSYIGLVVYGILIGLLIFEIKSKSP